MLLCIRLAKAFFYCIRILVHCLSNKVIQFQRIPAFLALTGILSQSVALVLKFILCLAIISRLYRLNCLSRSL